MAFVTSSFLSPLPANTPSPTSALRRGNVCHASQGATRMTAEDDIAPAANPIAKPDPSAMVDRFYPPATRDLAPHIVFLSSDALALDNTRVVVSPGAASVRALSGERGANDAPDASTFVPPGGAGAAINCAPVLEVMPDASSVSVAMTRAMAGQVGGAPAPDASLYEQYFPGETRFLAPEIDIQYRPGGVGLEMREIGGTAEAEKEAAPENRFGPNMNNMAPFIDMSDNAVVKVQMRGVEVDAEEVDRPPFDGYPQYEKYGGLNRAPCIEINTLGGGAYELSMEMRDMPTFQAFNAAPVISIGEPGTEISVEMSMIDGARLQDSMASEAINAKASPKAYSSGWKASSKFDKAWV